MEITSLVFLSVSHSCFYFSPKCVNYIFFSASLLSSLCRPSVSVERGSREREDRDVFVPPRAGARHGDTQPQGDGPAA